MKEKVTLKPITPNTIYFPSFDEFAVFLGFGVSARSKVNMLRELLGSDLKISTRSLDNLGSKGVKEKTVRRAGWPILRFLFKNGLLQYFKGGPKELRATDVIHGWRIPLFSFNHANSGINLQLMHAFLNHRNELYQPIKKFIESSTKLTPDNQKELLTSFYHLVLPHTLLLQEEKKELFRVITSDDIDGEVNSHNRAYFQFLFYDFHLSLIAALDLTILTNFNLMDKYENGIFGNVLKQEGETYLSKLLNQARMKHDYSYYSDYQLAKFIPIKRNQDDELSTSLLDAQINTLKEWRSGKTHPTPKTLTLFFESFDSNAYVLPILLVAILCTGLDKRLKDSKMGQWKDGFKKTFSAQRYSIYFQHFKKKLPELAALD